MKGSALTAFGRLLLGLRYRVSISGLDAIKGRGKGGILFLPNHPAYVDPMLLMAHLFPEFQPHTLADQDMIAAPWIRRITGRLGVQPIPDPARHGEACRPEVERVIQACIEGLRRGENWLLYPAGRIYHSRFEDLGGNSAVETILAQAPELRVVLIRTSGLWGSSFGRASGHPPQLVKGLVHGFKCLLANFLLFGPRREVKLELAEPSDLPRREGRAVLNRYLEGFYNQDPPPARYVPYTLWERGGARDLPEPETRRIEGDLGEVPPTIHEQVLAKLVELAGNVPMPEAALLAKDLGLDSLSRMELQTWIEQEFGHEVPDPESLQSVADCMLAACGKATGGGKTPLAPPSGRWFAPTLPVQVPEGDTLMAVFLRQAARGMGRPAFADPQGGVKTYRDLLTAILALKPRLEALEGEHVGIMLPASGAAAVVYLATLFAGKIPVMVNWTAGSRNLVHGMECLGVRTILTAGQLVSKVEGQGADLSAIRDRFLFLEELGKSLRTTEKLRAAALARLSWRSLRRVRGHETAVVLFTSGSENLPKAVPLTHGNLLANIRDLVGLIPFEPTERMIGFLPPFHSFGLTATTLLPLCSGLPVAYFPNPTDGASLAQVVDTYRVTMLVGTPTFLSGIVRVAADAQLATLRMVVSGAEKCPESLYETLERRWPGMRVLEGYGITECSPVVSVNRWEAPRRGTIGKPLPSLETVLIHPESGAPVALGEAGMLLVRGPSIFSGYLQIEGPSPFATFEGRDWYRTGDLVRQEPDGTLVFAGRLKRFVKLGGEMISLPAVEEVLLRRFARDEDAEICLAVEATPSESQPELVLFSLRPIAREEANEALRQAGLSALHFIRQTREIEKIPVLGTGKTDYRALKALLV